MLKSHNTKAALRLPEIFLWFLKIFLWLLKKRRKQKDITLLIFSQLYIFFLTFCILFFVFRLLTNPGQGTLGMLFGEYMWDIFPQFLLSYFIVLIICEFLYFTTFFLYVPLFTVYPVITIASVANIAKINFRNEPIVFSDLLLSREALNIAAEYPLGLEPHMSFLVPVFILLLILPVFLRRPRFNLKKRMVSALTALIVAGGFFSHMLIAEYTVLEQTARLGIWSPVHEYRRNGFILKFMVSVKRTIMFAPPDYNRANVIEFAAALGYPENHVMAEAPEILPNVIVIMNESFWDTDNLTGIAFNKDPLESLRGIMERTGNPQVLVPHMGGGTANMEFEFLTGNNIIFYPPGSMIYQQFINRPHWSLAWYFREFGYATTAIHPYYDWFWRRSTVYPLLGFENIFFNNGSLNYVDTMGRFISDQAVSWEIISRYHQFSEGGRRPVFTFAVTMQNHGPYCRYRYSCDQRQIRLLNNMDDEAADMVEAFAEGLRFAAEAFIYLTEYFSNVERPTYIIMFGDHSPTPIANMNEFYAITADGELTEHDVFRKYVTPLIVWSNQSRPEFYETARNIRTVTTQMLAAEIFNITGMPRPAYIEMLANIKNTVTRGFTHLYKLDTDGNHSPSYDFSGSPEIRAVYEKLRVVQYDITLGRNYLSEWFANNN